MPWKPSDADKHKKGLSAQEKKQWAETANAVLRETGDEARAVRIANSQTKKK
jgi:uncharacterized protein YdaT